VILEAILNRSPMAPTALNPELPVRLQEVINNCLEKDRELRYQSAADLRADLKRVRRDMESGHSQAVEVVGSRGASRGPGRTPSTGNRYLQDDRVPVSAAAPRSARSRVGLIAAGVGVVAVIAAGSYAVWRRPPAPPAQDASRIAALSDEAIRNRLALARSSLEARNYRAAVTYATEVLAVDSNHPGAAKIRDEARTMLEAFDAAVAEARRHLASGDVSAAARSLDAARTIDPTAPSVSDLSARLAEQVRQREAVNQVTPKQRPVPQPSTGATRTPPAAPVPTPSAPPQAASGSAASQPAPRAQTPPAVPVEPPPAQPPSTVVPPPPLPEPSPPRPVPSAPVAAERREPEPSSPSVPSAEEEEAAIRKVIAVYARAIENKDLALFRSIKPNLSGEEERRLQAGFRAVTSQRVNLTILSIQRRGDEASLVLRRQDTIDVGRRQQTAQSQQTLTMARTRGNWVITDIR
jgi:hypothetical protein